MNPIVRNLASQSTSRTHISPSQSSTDHIPFQYPIHFPESLSPSSLSSPAWPHECPASRVDQLPISTSSEERLISISETLLRSNRTTSRVSEFTTTVNHLLDSEPDRGLVSTRDYVFTTPHSESGSRVPVTFDLNDEISDRGSLSEPEYISGIGYVLRRVRRGTRVERHMRQRPLATEGRFPSPLVLFFLTSKFPFLA